MNLRTVFVANRGEIAHRVVRTARSHGYRTAVVASSADRGLQYVDEADVAILLDGPPDVRHTYLDGARMLDAARRAGADAIHPGYGFLSENADFADAVIAAGLVWIGPPPSAVRALGDKASARTVAQANGVPVVPGYDGDERDVTALRGHADAVGYPLLIKATAGGGGRGMRRVDGPADFAEALASARAEASSSFGSDAVILERYLLRPRHVEVQVFGDTHGNVVYLGDRDCSVQRRHQKVLEEAPAPGLSVDVRRAMGEAAVRVARAVGYTNAGTVEFLFDSSGEWFFLEMNTRLQVEHPVTEQVTGLDLVALQLRVAEGRPLPFGQADLHVVGHSIEARVYAEDPLRDYLPATGRIRALSVPLGDGIRLDAGFRGGDEVSPYYDAMVAKVIATGPDRATALRRLSRALDGAWVPGLVTNLPLLREIARHRAFAEGELHTGFLAANGLPTPPPANVELGVLAAMAHATASGPQRRGWRVWGRAAEVDVYRAGATEVPATCTPAGTGFDAVIGGVTFVARDLERVPGGLRLSVDGVRRLWRVLVDEDPAGHGPARVWVHAGDAESYVERAARFPAVSAAEAEPGACVAPTPGKVTSVRVAVGDVVDKGQILGTLEAMKMEHRVVAPAAGTVAAVRAEVGAAVREGELLFRVE